MGVSGRSTAAGGPLCVSERVDERRRTYFKSSSVYPETLGAPVMEQEIAIAMLTLQEIRCKEMETRWYSKQFGSPWLLFKLCHLEMETWSTGEHSRRWTESWRIFSILSVPGSAANTSINGLKSWEEEEVGEASAHPPEWKSLCNWARGLGVLGCAVLQHQGMERCSNLIWKEFLLFPGVNMLIQTANKEGTLSKGRRETAD